MRLRNLGFRLSAVPQRQYSTRTLSLDASCRDGYLSGYTDTLYPPLSSVLLLFCSYANLGRQEVNVRTPVRYAIYPWIATATQGQTAVLKGWDTRLRNVSLRLRNVSSEGARGPTEVNVVKRCGGALV